MTQQAIKVFEKEFMIDSGPQGAPIPLSDLLQMAINTSESHDKKVIPYIEQYGPYLIQIHHTWVITQYHIQLDQLPLYREPFTIKTCVVEANRFFISRLFEVKVGERVIATLFAQFAAIDLNERKMVRLNAKAFSEANLLTENIAPDYVRIQLPDNKQVSTFITKHHQVVDEDIDHNRHVNNGSYLRWIERQLPASIHTQYSKAQLDIKYGKEILPDEQVKIDTYIEKTETGLVSTHLIWNLTQDTEACRIRIYWTNN